LETRYQGRTNFMQSKLLSIAAILLVAAVALAIWLFPPVSREPVQSLADDNETLSRGEYLAHAAGCISCHLGEDNDSALIGGRQLASDFGTFYVPNITPDIATGIGAWGIQDIVVAIKHGRSPEGDYYLPAFPYRSHSSMADEDAAAIATWLLSQPAVESIEPDHELPVPIWLARLAMGPWNRLADLLSPEFPEYEDQQVERGAYLVRTLGHCGECHTPRNRVGISDYENEFAGAPLLDGHVEGINPESLQYWTEGDMAFFLLMGIKPDDEYVGGEMELVIEHNTAPLTQTDRNAIAAFLIRGQ
jgi:mono/diheme cytochrome c family protein